MPYIREKRGYALRCLLCAKAMPNGSLPLRVGLTKWRFWKKLISAVRWGRTLC